MKVKKLIKRLKKVLKEKGNMEVVIVFDGENSLLYGIENDTPYVHKTVNTCAIEAGRA